MGILYCTMYTIIIIIVINVRLLTHVNSIFEYDRSVCASAHDAIEWKMFAYDRILSFIHIYIKLSSLWWFIHVSLITQPMHNAHKHIELSRPF